MKLVEQWRRLWADLPAGWADAKLALTAPDALPRSRAAALLGPAAPGVVGDELRFTVSRAGHGIGPDQVTKLLGKIDGERIRGTLTLLEAAEAAPRQETPRELVADAWATAVVALPPDWSDLYGEVELASSDHLERAALLLAPLNPTRVPGRSALRFRAARTFGYGASPQMTARCFERLDVEGIQGRLTVLRVLSGTHNVDTQGPVWRLEGKAV